MVKDLFDQLMDEVNAEILDPKKQEELREVITQTPENFRKTVEQQELGMDGINRNEAGEYEQRGRPPDPSTLKAALLRVEKRMLRESPSLITYKLKFKGGNLMPDVAAYRREFE